jgi:ATP-dependent Zn protease
VPLVKVNYKISIFIKSNWSDIFSLLPIIIIIGVWIFYHEKMSGEAERTDIFNIGKSKAKLLMKKQM